MADPTPVPPNDPLSVVCPKCGASPGEWCTALREGQPVPPAAVNPFTHMQRRAPPSPATESAPRTDLAAKALDAARALLAKLERLQDAIERADPVPGQKLLPRAQRESAEHAALREAFAALDAASPAPSPTPSPAATRDPEWKLSEFPCRKCGKGPASYRIVTSSDGAHDDENWRCAGCGAEGWVDGIDA